MPMCVHVRVLVVKTVCVRELCYEPLHHQSTQQYTIGYPGLAVRVRGQSIVEEAAATVTTDIEKTDLHGTKMLSSERIGGTKRMHYKG